MLEKFAIVTTELLPFSGGIGVYAHHTAKMLSEAGVDVTVFFYSDDVHGKPARITHTPYKVVRFCDLRFSDGQRIEVSVDGFIGISYRIEAFIADYRSIYGEFDVIEFQDYGAISYFYLKDKWLYRHKSNEKIILTAHRPYFHAAATDDASVYEHTVAFLGDLERWCYRAADAVFAPCEFIVGALASEKYGFKSDFTHVVYNPYKLEPSKVSHDAELLRSELRRLIGTPSEPILFFGKMQAQKGIKELLKSLSALWDKGFSHPLWIFGRDAIDSAQAASMLEVLTKQFSRHFVEGRVRYFGGYSQSFLEEVGAEHPIVVAPFREECLPYAFIEGVQGGSLPLFRLEGGQIELTPPDLLGILVADFYAPALLQERLSELFSWNRERRAQVSARLKDFGMQKVSYASVLKQKLIAFKKLRSRSVTEEKYPFVYDLPNDDAGKPRNARNGAPVNGTVISVERSEAYAAKPIAATASLISVVIPFYEMQNYCDETLNSIFNSVYGEVEAVIVDDGSHSSAAHRYLATVIDRFKSRHIKIVRKYNGGLSDARNAGANCATGDFLYFLDADDMIHPSFFGEAMPILARLKNVSYVGAWLREFGIANGRWIAWDVDSPYICFHNVQICSFLIHKKAWIEHGYNDQKMTEGMEDYESHIRMFSAGVRGVSIPKYYFNYRIREDSMARAFNPNVVAYLYRIVIRNNSKIFKYFGDQLAGLLAENGHGALAGPPSVRTDYFNATFAGPGSAARIKEGSTLRLASSARVRDVSNLRLADGSPYSSYLLAQKQLALGLHPEYSVHLLRDSRTMLKNGWILLFSALAEFRIGNFSHGSKLCSEAINHGSDDVTHAIRWYAQMEAVLGFPHSARGVYHTIASIEGSNVVDAGGGVSATAGWGEPVSFAALQDGQFSPIFEMLWEARRAMKNRNRRGAAIFSSLSQHYCHLLSTEATGRALGRWMLWWWAADGHDPADLRSAISMVSSGLQTDIVDAMAAAAMLRPFDSMARATPTKAHPEIERLCGLGRAVLRNEITGPIVSPRALPNPVSLSDWHAVRQIMSAQLSEAEIKEYLHWAYASNTRFRLKAWLEHNISKLIGKDDFKLPDFGSEAEAARKIGEAGLVHDGELLVSIEETDRRVAGSAPLLSLT